MSYKPAQIPNLADGETGYELTDEPRKSSLIAVRVTTDIQLDGEGHFAAQTFRAIARWVDEHGASHHFPGRDIPVTATNRHTCLDGSTTSAEVIAELLDGVIGNPRPLPSPIRRAIAAAQAMAATKKAPPAPAKK